MLSLLEESIPVVTHTVAILQSPHYGKLRFEAGPARFSLYPGETIPSLQPSGSAPTEASQAGETEETDEKIIGAWEPVVGPLILAHPFHACGSVYSDGFYTPVDTLHEFGEPVTDGSEDIDEAEIQRQRGLLSGAIAVVKRGTCSFSEKARHLKEVSRTFL